MLEQAPKWLICALALIFLIYVIGISREERFAERWLVQRLMLGRNSSEIFDALNSTDLPSNSTFNSTGLPSNSTYDAASMRGGVVLNANLSAHLFQPQPKNLPLCPERAPNLTGPISLWLNESITFTQIQSLYPDLELGGHGHPKSCLARHRVAILVPYRDREPHLRLLLYNLHSLLQKQQLDYVILVVEQAPNQTFNRAKLLNVGFKEANKLYDWACYVFHDVNLLPEDDRNVYSCPLKEPRQHAATMNKFGYKPLYKHFFGGVSAMTREQFLRINGFSNDYWGWGGEDDDASTRLAREGYTIARYPLETARYTMIYHVRDLENPANECRYKLLNQTQYRYRENGLSNLDYGLLSVDLYPTHTRVLVDLFERASRDRLIKNPYFRTC